MNGFFYTHNQDNTEQKIDITSAMRLSDVAPDGVVCALADGRIVSLAAAPENGTHMWFLSPLDDELASRVFLRGAVFLLYCAARALFPQCTLVVEHMLYGGAYCTLGSIGGDDIAALNEKISGYIAADGDFEETTVSADDAKALFLKQGMVYKAALMDDHLSGAVRMFSFDGQQSAFYGVMPKSAGYLRGMTLLPYAGGLILRYPAPYREAKRPIVRQKKYSAVFRQAEHWADVLGVSYVSDLNGMVHSGRIAEFIRVNEALHERTIAGIASDIAARADVRVVLIAGPSSSGKTTFATRLSVHLKAIGKKSRAISLDNYYLDRCNTPRGADGQPDFECLDALDIPKLNSDLKSMIAGETVELPVFDFLTGCRRAEAETVRLDDELIILEGIHGLNDKLTRDVPEKNKFKIFIAPLTTLNRDRLNIIVPEDLRLLRRLVRDKRTRGYSFEQTFAVWDSVRRGEFKYILPYQETADVMFNSTLVYEPLILKKHAMMPLLDMTPAMPGYARAQLLLAMLDVFLSRDDESDIPPNSILREFIG